ncbi:2-isopropylmalate synthase [Sinomicrobium weinanense]|uniref:2-isopropylmalate synthase n=1 Tax=Sinomicrobium weinanense TaxID=2842200 RepID=A0A926JUI6_9FLAO|nr:2-isopropylmalate synthase [Sinomicrobium weinanense]MBC9797493.1 2-isopropylmalate synthase [Sinomicrobium weinanense]MBU3122221.1 2-isopropylmalate synthase [Sinomicrobium weinanense]
MLQDPGKKYSPNKLLNLPDRKWPDRVQQCPPVWCSVDMRDGNQALINPMGASRKRRFFDLLTRMGFKEVEVGFPAASSTDYNYVRELIEEGKIPDDVTVQVMTQARPALIQTTFEALRGVPRAIVHLYNATAPFFRDVVFGVDRKGCIRIATDAARAVKRQMEQYPGSRWTFQYSPETFCFTEPDFGLEICNAVIAEFDPTPENKMILNLPTTVEVSTPNVFADHIEWFCRHIDRRDSLIISVHPHNDRGTAVATAELACLAGAERVEGTLFGNGERTGNVDIMTLALNLYTSGIAPGLDFSDMDTVAREVTHCNQLPVHPRHPYAGELVFTAFSGSHQDAIKKGFAARKADPGGLWEVPYLPVDPADLGRNYEAIIRVNSQSGKGGVAYVLEQHGIVLPRELQIEFSRIVQEETERAGGEISEAQLLDSFSRTYFSDPAPYRLRSLEERKENTKAHITASLETPGNTLMVEGTGDTLQAAFAAGCVKHGLCTEITDIPCNRTKTYGGKEIYSFVKVRSGAHDLFGAGRDRNEARAFVKAVLCAINRGISKALLNSNIVENQ